MNPMLLTKSGSILGPIATVFGYIMDLLFKMTSQFGIMNIGLCIILFTIITKILLFPLTMKQQMSTKLMSRMNPEIQAVQKKYKGKTDQTSMARQQAEMSAIYEKYGSNPTAGCLPTAIQLPILFALYRIIYNIPAYVPSVRVFFDNVAKPLQAQPDYINKIADLAQSANMSIDKIDFTNIDKVVDLLYKFTPEKWAQLQSLFPAISDVIGQNAATIEKMNTFLGINLSVAPYTGITHPSIAWLIPILAGVTQLLSTKLMTAATPQAPDAPGADMMKSMTYTMPLMSVFICFTLPSAIGIYWVMQGLIMLIQQIIVNKYMEKVDVDTLIAKNVEKMNKKRAKQGLPPVRQNQTQNGKAFKPAPAEPKNDNSIEKIAKSKKVQDTASLYNKEAKAGSIASKARMVKTYNEKQEENK